MTRDFDEEGLRLFPLYWTENPRKIKAYHVRNLDIGDVVVVETLNALPHRLPARSLVDCIPREDCDQRAFGMSFIQFAIFINKVMLT